MKKHTIVITLILAFSQLVFANTDDSKAQKKLAKIDRKIQKMESDLHELKRLYKSLLPEPQTVKSALQALKNEDKVNETRQEILNLDRSVKRYIKAAMKKPVSISQLVEKGFLKEIPKDAWNNPLHYEITSDAKGYACFSCGIDGIKSKDDVTAEIK